MSKKPGSFRKIFNTIVAVAAVVLIGKMIITNTAAFLNILKVMVGFGGVIMIHEFGHFIVAKKSGIKVEAFSIGFPPTLLGIQKTDKGTRFRVLPKMGAPEKNEDGTAKVDESGICFTIPSKNPKPSETEYRIGMIPAGGFVAMMGQSDSGPVEQSDDPGSYMNKSIATRIAVVAAGVIFNVISAVFIFMFVFTIGLDLPPAVVGGVMKNSPAEKAGFLPGDTILSIDGDEFVDFTSIPMAAALSDKGQPITMHVRHFDGTEETINVIAKDAANMPLKVRKLGIIQPVTAALPKADRFVDGEAEALKELTGMRPGDVVTAVNGIAVEHGWQMEKLISQTISSTITLSVKHTDDTTEDVILPIQVSPNLYNFETNNDLAHVFSLVPRLKITHVDNRTKTDTWQDRVKLWWQKNILRKAEILAQKSPLLPGDIIVNIAGTDNPTFTEMREITAQHEDKAMPITVLRKNDDGILESKDLEVTPLRKLTRSGKGPVNIGIIPMLDIEHPVVAKTIAFDEDNPALNIPAGATILKINGESIDNYYQIAQQLSASKGKKVTIDCLLPNAKKATLTAIIPSSDNAIYAEATLAAPVPFASLREIYKADNPAQAVTMGLKKTKQFVVQTLITLKGLFTRSISPTTLSGPLGIVTVSYTIASRSTMYYLYFLGLISSCIAVMNLLPLPVVDGGVIIMLIIEKIKGSPINQKIQEFISYGGLALILLLFGWLIWNDTLNMIFMPPL